MDRTTLVEQLVMSEKNHAIVEIKIANNDKLVVGAVQKVLNQMIILKSPVSGQVTLTFADIESVNRQTQTFLEGALRTSVKMMKRIFRR